MRNYCLGKLREVVTPIFVQYHHSSTVVGGDEEMPAATSAAPPANDEGMPPPPPPPPPEEKAIDQASSFVAELEECVFEAYSEPDKKGKRVAGAKYK